MKPRLILRKSLPGLGFLMFVLVFNGLQIEAWKGDAKVFAAPPSPPVRSKTSPKAISAATNQKNSSIQGTVTFRGTVPLARIPDSEGRLRELLSIRRGRLQYAVAFLKATDGTSLSEKNNTQLGTLPNSSEKKKPVRIDQKDFAFVPSLVAIRSGDPVEFSNSDPSNHNVRSSSLIEENQFNTLTGVGGNYVHRFKADAKNRPVRLGCDIHPWMGAWVYVFDHPWYAVTDQEGKFRITNVPPGKYLLSVRQPDGKLSWEKEVEILKDKLFELQIEFKSSVE